MDHVLRVRRQKGRNVSQCRDRRCGCRVKIRAQARQTSLSRELDSDEKQSSGKGQLEPVGEGGLR